MTYIKKVVMHGFKSFARKTEIPLENAMNVIVGPNGSGKSNVTDALCFVLGRRSMKSIRAPNAAGLLFSGNKLYKGASEAYVEIVLDNSDKTFAVDSAEISIKRIVRKNGNSIYKINEETKTLQEVLELLSQGGIDPNGFNIVLQGEIGSLVKSTPEERRKILEEVAGISIYEARKHKSIKELERTDERLKEVSAVLKERNNYLKTLEKERQDALNKKKLEETIIRCKGTILSKTLSDKTKLIEEVTAHIEKYQKEVEKTKEKISSRNIDIEQLKKRIEDVSKKVESSKEQEDLYNEVSNLNAEVAGLKVRKENFENRIATSQDKALDNKAKKDSLLQEISKIKTSSPEIKKQQEKQRLLESKLEELEKKRRRFYNLKSEVSTKENQKEERERILIESKKEIELVEHSIISLTNEIKYANSLEQVHELKKRTRNDLEESKTQIEKLEKSILDHERIIAIFNSDIKREEKIRDDIVNLKTCFICKQDVEEGHKHKISADANEKITFSSRKLKESEEIRERNSKKIIELKESVSLLTKKLNELDIDEIKLNSSEEKKERIKKLVNERENAKKELVSLNETLHSLKLEFEKLKDIEEEYDETRLKIQELSFIDLDVDTEVAVKQRELNRLDMEIKAYSRSAEEDAIELTKILTRIKDKEVLIQRKGAEADILYNKNQKAIEERTALQDSEKAAETDIIGYKHEIRNIDDRINDNKIRKAEYEAQAESVKEEISALGPFEIIKDTIENITKRLHDAQFRISRLGEVNMKSVEAFDLIKEQVVKIQEKVTIIERERDKIVNIIEEIDKKKKKSFITTLEAVNQYFTRNFSQLSKKGEVFLELEDQKDPFAGGLNILIKVSRGKYFDIQSLSGGERTLVALSLIFAIQEYKPYNFYIFDEIDAALDKRNSELLAALIKKYMTSGQYIIITHNDTLITEATNLYGVSMQENISKVISLKV